MLLTPYTRRHNDLMFNPFYDLDSFEKDLFGDNTINALKTDIRDAGEEFILEADMPGFSKDDIHVDLQDDTMTISAQRHSEFEEKDKKGNYLRQERTFGSFTRSFHTEGIQTDAIKASFENGVLTLHLPKQQKQQPVGRRLEIE